MTQTCLDEVELVFPNASWAPGLTCSWDLTSLPLHAWPLLSLTNRPARAEPSETTAKQRDGQREGVGIQREGSEKKKEKCPSSEQPERTWHSFDDVPFTMSLYKWNSLKQPAFWMSFCLSNSEWRGTMPAWDKTWGPSWPRLQSQLHPSSTATGGQPPVSGSTGHKSPRESSPPEMNHFNNWTRLWSEGLGRKIRRSRVNISRCLFAICRD